MALERSRKGNNQCPAPLIEWVGRREEAVCWFLVLPGKKKKHGAASGESLACQFVQGEPSRRDRVCCRPCRLCGKSRGAMQARASRLARQAGGPVPREWAPDNYWPQTGESRGRKGAQEWPPGTLPTRSAVFHWFAASEIIIILLSGGLIGGCANYGEIIH